MTVKLTEFVVWTGNASYVIHAANPIGAIQAAIECHHSFVPASQWNWQDMAEYSHQVNQKIRANAITA